jgi:hypothetical protein
MPPPARPLWSLPGRGGSGRPVPESRQKRRQLNDQLGRQFNLDAVRRGIGIASPWQMMTRCPMTLRKDLGSIMDASP